MSKDIKTMREYREKMNNFIMQADNKNIKRFFAIDHQVYEKGALDKKTKELTDEELYETISIALIVGGSITIPHIRFLIDKWEQLKKT